MNRDGKEQKGELNQEKHGGSAFRWVNDYEIFNLHNGIDSKLLHLFVNDSNRISALPIGREIIWNNENRETIPGQPTITIEELEQELNNYFSESIKNLNELGKTYQPKFEEEKVLCNKLLDFIGGGFNKEFDEDTKKTNIIIVSPTKSFIKENYEHIINVRKKYLPNRKPLKEKKYLEDKEQYVTIFNDIVNDINLNDSQKVKLQNIQKYFEDGALKYPCLMHVVLEWPILTLMPKPPTDILDHCEKSEYEMMLKRQKGHWLKDSSFSTPETQSSAWFIYPKGETWCKESGIKRFQELFLDINNALGYNWEVLLHSYGLTISHGNNHHFLDDGWDGLFDEDYTFYFDHDGWRNGLYNCYYITDVFYESVRLCRYFLNKSATKPTADNENQEPKDLMTLTVTVSKYNVSKSTVRRAIKEKKLTRYRENEFEIYVSESEVKTHWPLR